MADDMDNLPNDAGDMNEEVSWEDAFQEAAAGSPQAQAAMRDITDAPLPSFSSPGLGSKKGNGKNSGVDLDFLLDISLNVTAEIGRAKMEINELLQLNQGSLIPLDKQVGESIDVLVNGKLMARGEVVMVNEMFAIRLTEIIGPKERIQQLT